MKKLFALILAVLLAGCAGPAMVKVQGEHVVKDKLAVKVDAAWNRLTSTAQPFEVWTQEGASLDQLRFWAAVPAGQALMKATPGSSGQKDQRVPTFTTGMSPDQLVTLFEEMYSADGSLVKVAKIEPGTFAGERGVHFELAITRKGNDLLVRCAGWAAVRNNQLYAATFMAPQLSFYPRLLPQAEAVIASARIKS
jgi:hypothetical protein